MKNNTVSICAVSLIFIFALGCGITDRLKESVGIEKINANSSAPSNHLTEKNATPDVKTELPDGEKIGIPECDEAFDLLTEHMKPKEDEPYISKSGKEYYLSTIRDSLRESIKNEKDHEKLAKKCTQILENLKKYNPAEEGRR